MSPETAVSPAPAELTLADALALAIHLHRTGEADDAERLYRRILEAAPVQPDALHFLGVLRHQRGDSEGAVDLIRRAIDSMPGAPDPWNNLGNVYVESGRIDDAVAAYHRCLALAPDFADTHNNLGTLHRLRSEWSESEASYRRAIDARPDFADAYTNLARLMAAQRRPQEAVACACKAITLLPHDPEARKLLGLAYYTLGEYDKAAEVYREWLAAEPGNPIAVHHLAACSGEAVPARASDAYVARTFDAFADSFDAKLELLSYRAPQLVVAGLRSARGEPARSLDVLDAGCGTGLCGPLLRDFARELTGIDLSPRMLEKARRRGVYDRLETAELAGWMATQPQRFDAVVSADTLCYFGDLAPVMQAAHGALRAGGTLVFTVEALADGSETGYALHAHGRYVHAEAYVRACLEAAELWLLAITREPLRREGGASVVGWLVSAEKAR